MQQHGSKYFALITPSQPSNSPPPPDPRDGVSRSNSFFSEHGHVAYHIKENKECSNIVANIFPADPPIPGTGSVGQNSSF